MIQPIISSNVSDNKVPNQAVAARPADIYDRFFAKMEEELNRGGYDIILSLFQIIINGPTHSLVKQRPDLATKLVFQIAIPRLNDPKFPQELNAKIPLVISALKTQRLFTNNQAVEETITIVCKDGEVEFNEFLLLQSDTNYFAAALQRGFKESKIKKLEMKNFSVEAFLNYKRFVYESVLCEKPSFDQLFSYVEIYQLAVYFGSESLLKASDEVLWKLTYQVDTVEKFTTFINAINQRMLDEKRYEQLYANAARIFEEKLESKAHSVHSEGQWNAFVEAIEPLQGSEDDDQKKLYAKLYQLGLEAFRASLQKNAESVKTLKDLHALLPLAEKLKVAGLMTEDQIVSICSLGVKSFLSASRIPFRSSIVLHRFCIPHAKYVEFEAPAFAYLKPYIKGVMITENDLEETLFALSLEKRAAIKEIAINTHIGNAFIPNFLKLLPDLDYLQLELSSYSEVGLSGEIRKLDELAEILPRQAKFLQCVRFIKSLGYEQPAKLTGICLKPEQLDLLKELPPIMYGDNLLIYIEQMKDSDEKSLVDRIKNIETFKCYDITDQIEESKQFGYGGSFYHLIRLKLKKELGGSGQFIKTDDPHQC